MGVSNERIQELFAIMLENADEEGWCELPDNLSEDEELELSKHLTLVTMRDRIDTIVLGIQEITDYNITLRDNLTEYNTLEIIKIKKSLGEVKTDIQNILIDLHSDDIVSNFFNIEMINIDCQESKEEAIKMKEEMINMVNDELSEELDNVKKQCLFLLELGDKLLHDIKD